MPDVRIDVGQRLAGIGINKLNIHEQGHTGLVLGHVATDELSGDVCSVNCKVIVSVEGIAQKTYSKDPESPRAGRCRCRRMRR